MALANTPHPDPESVDVDALVDEVRYGLLDEDPDPKIVAGVRMLGAKMEHLVAKHGDPDHTCSMCAGIEWPVGPRPLLTERQVQIVALIYGGLTDAEIGERLGIATSTVSNHVHRLYNRLGLEGRRRKRVCIIVELIRHGIERWEGDGTYGRRSQVQPAGTSTTEATP